jgi:2,3-bisphosphoglycerate-independent phosphoglycerate mutase
MKYVLIIPEGAPGAPLEALGGQTPLQAASLPALDALAARGRLGTAPVTVQERFLSEGGAQIGVLGYAPEEYPVGEGALTAHACGLEADAQDHVFRSDLVTVLDGCLRDFTAGFIRATEAAPLIDALNAAFADEPFRFHACGGYRNLCVWKQAGVLPTLRTVPPDRMLHEPIKRHMPRGDGAKPLYDLILRAHALLREHDVNLVRQDLGESVASALWLWGNGPLPALPSFQERHGVRGALAAGSDVTRGIGRLIGWDVQEVPGATGLLDTDYAAKGRTAVAALDDFDLVAVHVQAPHIAALLGRTETTKAAIEAIDRRIVTPLVERLETESAWRMLVIAAQAISAAKHPELSGRTLLVLAGTGIESHRGEAFDEENALNGELHPDRIDDLMEYFLHR